MTILGDHTAAPTRTAQSGQRELLFEEAFRTLRANLLLRFTPATKILMVTGARPLEGKSTIAANLACSFASTGRHVALVDADLRRPRQHELFAIPREPGLADALSGRVPIERCISNISKSLAVVPSGTAPADPIALLDETLLDAVLAPLAKVFNLVVIDSPPVLAVTDPVLIAKRADAVLLVLRWGEVSLSEARLVRQRLESTRAKIIGSVISQFPAENGSNYHPYVRDYADGHTPTLKPVNHSA